METFLGIMIPFLGTTLGAACVFFMKKSLGDLVQRALAGFAAGVMVAASIWSLLIPAIDQCAPMGKWAFLPSFLGFWVGILFLLLLTAGFLFYESADLRNGGLGLLLSCGCGGALAGVLGGKPKKKRRR